MKKTLLFLFMLGAALSTGAQSNVKLLLNVDVGGGNLLGDINDSWLIRQDVDSYYNYYNDYSYAPQRVLSSAYLRYFSVKPEFRFSDRISLYTGLRFAEVNSSFSGLGREDAYFFLKLNGADVGSTELFRIKSISEKNAYLSIPLEARFTLVRPSQWRGFRVYAKIGGDIGVLLNSNKKIDFLLESMKEYEDYVIDQVGLSSNKLLSSIYLGFGIGYEMRSGWAFNLDIPAYSHFLTKNNSTLTAADVLAVVQFSLAMPLDFPRKEK